jgi:hypothetical protein
VIDHESLFECGSAAPRRWPPIEKSPRCTL